MRIRPPLETPFGSRNPFRQSETSGPPKLAGGSASRTVAVILATIAIIGIAAGIVTINQLGQQAVKEDIGRLERHADAQSQSIEDLITAATRDLRLARRNVIFEAALSNTPGQLLPEDRQLVEQAILYMGERYNVDEICVIRTGGLETARWVGGKGVAPVDSLSPDERLNNPAVLPTLRLADDHVWRTDPYVSPDSNRWVFGLATPIVLSNGQTAGILHFEIPVVALARQLDARPFGESAYTFVVSRDGALLIHPDIARFRVASGLSIDPATAAFPQAASIGSPSWQAAVKTIVHDGSGETTFEDAGRTYHVVFRPALDGDYTVASVSPDDELFADVGRDRTNLIVTVGPLLLLLLGIAGWFGGRLAAKNRQLALANRASSQLAAIVESAEDAVLSLDLDGTIQTWNEGAEEMYSYGAAEMVGEHIARLFVPERRDDLPGILASVAGGEPVKHHESVHVTEDGRLLDISLTCSPIRDASGEVRGSSVVARDISERKRLEDKLAYQALHDNLTGLPNRALFLDRLRDALRTASRPAHRGVDDRVAVCFVDLDNFKLINDSLGHAAGDQLLVQLGQRLNESLRAGDTAARFGGDEFTVLLTGLRHPDDASEAAERMLRRMKLPFTLGSSEVIVTASIGLAVSSYGSERPDDLLRNADLALYEAKSRGKARHEVFDPQMTAEAWRRVELEGQLRRSAIEGDKSPTRPKRARAGDEPADAGEGNVA